MRRNADALQKSRTARAHGTRRPAHSIFLCLRGVSVEDCDQVFQVNHAVPGHIAVLCLRPVLGGRIHLVEFLRVDNVEQVDIAIAVYVVLGADRGDRFGLSRGAVHINRLAVLVIACHLRAGQLDRHIAVLVRCGEGQARNVGQLFLGQAAAAQVAEGQLAGELIAILGPLDVVKQLKAVLAEQLAVLYQGLGRLPRR